MSDQIAPILILHGWNHNLTYWKNAHSQVDINKHPLFIPDLPGFGQNTEVSSDWNIPEYAQWVSTYVQEHLLKSSLSAISPATKVIVLGHSFGGRIASYIASQNPSWMSKLILYAAPVLYRPTLTTQTKILLYKLGKALSFNSKLLREYIAHAHHEELSLADKVGMGIIYRNIVNFDQTNILSRIQVPTSIIIGTHDQEVRLLIAKETHTLISSSDYYELKGEGHNIHLDNPTLFYGLIRKIIANA